MIKRSLYVLTVLAVLTTNALAGSSDEVKKVVDEVRKIVNDKEMKKNEAKRRQALEKDHQQHLRLRRDGQALHGQALGPAFSSEKKQLLERLRTCWKIPMPARWNPTTTKRSSYLKENN